MTGFLALLPILILIFVSLLKGVKEAVIISLAITIILFFYWGAGFNYFLGALGISFLTTINILMIIFGAAFLYDTMERTGMINEISHSLVNVHPSNELRFFLLAIGLTAFFEGVAGFGTPGAIVPLLLIAIGFNAVLSVSVVLLLDGLFAIFGAVGTPVITGLQFPLSLSDAEIQKVSIMAATAAILIFFFLLFYIFRMYKKQHGKMEFTGKLVMFYFFFAIPFLSFAWFALEIATVLASLIMLFISVYFIKKKGTSINIKPWIPYLVLALLLLLPKIFSPLHRWIGWDMAFTEIFGTSLTASIKPLQSPLFPFLLVAIGVSFLKKTGTLYIKNSVRKVAHVFVVLFPSIAIAQLMIHSGAREPSMIDNIASMTSQLGMAYTLAAPFIGITGTFVTGSTTISNIVFGPSQLQSADLIGMPASLVLALQLVGASLGNAICLFNIIAAASIANLKNYKDVLKVNLTPAIAGGILFGLLGLFFLYLLQS